jgi:hypothetical protein
MKTYLVYVHIGKNESPILSDVASQAGSQENLNVILITDYPESYKDFPGRIIRYKRSQNKKVLKTFNSKYPEKRTLAGGYWLNTLERVFALNSLRNEIENDAQIIHTESDVYSYLSEDFLSIIGLQEYETALPRFNSERGIGSIIYFRNYDAIEKTLHAFEKILSEVEIENDMELLGEALNRGYVSELPTDLESALYLKENHYLIFDGAAFGQYLFGQDPFHQNGDYISGYVNPYSSVNYSKITWSVSEYNGKPYLSFLVADKMFFLANIHLHSKEKISPLEQRSIFWQRVINEANGLSSRTRRKSGIDSIHNEKPSIYTRIQISRRLGVKKSIRRIREKLLKAIKKS